MFRFEQFRCKSIELAEALELTIDEAKDELLMLFSKASGRTKIQLIANPEYFENAGYIEEFESLFQRRKVGEPIPYITGVIDFYGSSFAVNNNVLVPRPDTETLVDLLLEQLQSAEEPRLLELGVGSGIISIIALKNNLSLTAAATDISYAALMVARENAIRLLDSPTRLNLFQGDWFSPVIGQYDFIVSNPPYVSEGDSHMEHPSMKFEPSLALTSGPDGFRDLSLIIEKSPEYLNAGGWLILEHGFDQSSQVTAAMREAGFEEILTRYDLGGRPRVSGGRMPS